MKEITTYLTFDGKCRQASTFYAECLDAKLELHPFSEMPGDVPAASKDRIMHARISHESDTLLMASDTMPGHPFHPGNNFSVSIQCESLSEIEKLFSALSADGTVTMPLQDTFWGARFGMLTDQFGIKWMFNLDLAKKEV